MFYNNNMKKFALLTAMGLCLGFTACDNYEEPNPEPQKNPQEAIFEAGGVTVTAQTEQQNLTAIEAASGQVPVLTFDAVNVPDGYTVSMVMQLSKDDSFAGANEIETSTEDGAILVDPTALNTAYKAITKDPSAATIKVRYAGFLVNGSSKSRIGDPDTYFGPFDLNLVPLAPEKEIEASYVLQYSKDGKAWNDATFTHSATSQYDDPTFSLAITFTEDMMGEEGLYWQVKSASGKVFGVTEEEVFNDNGNLVENGTPAISFLAGPVLFNINMEDNTFSYIQAIECFWTPGKSNGWSYDDNNQVLWTDDYTNYYGYIYLDSEFKINPDQSWAGKDFGSDGGITYKQGEDGHYIGTGVAKGSANIKVATPGVYWVELNYGTRDLKLTECKVIGIIGSFNDWGETAAMTPSADYLTWTGEFALSAGDEWKFRANDGWDINLGGALDNLVSGGDNIKCTETGTYVITLNLKARPYTATVVKK